jgi:hypothetical protein
MEEFMTRAEFIFSIFFIFSLATGLQADVGVPVDGFPNWSERMIHVLVNRARSAPAEDLAGCSSCPDAHCYTPQPALAWNKNLAHTARFHATNLTSAGCGIQHDSPCVLESDIGTTYPESCDGSVFCGCVGGTATCNELSNSSTWDRLTLFGVNGGYRGENIASNADPFNIFYLWLWESSSSSMCEFTMENGHRYNILSDNYTHIGVGQDGNYTVQDFWSITPAPQKIPSGAHYPQSGSSIAFRANWYDAQRPNHAQVNINGTLHTMAVERGSEGNATYLYETAIGDSCLQYYFRFIDSTGDVVTYPSTGAFGINCTNDWTDSRPATRSIPAASPVIPLLLMDQ